MTLMKKALSGLTALLLLVSTPASMIVAYAEENDIGGGTLPAGENTDEITKGEDTPETEKEVVPDENADNPKENNEPAETSEQGSAPDEENLSENTDNTDENADPETDSISDEKASADEEAPESAPAKRAPEFSDDTEEVKEITNGSVRIKKEWVDGDGEDRPKSVELTLVDSNGDPVDVEGNPVTVSADTDWEGIIENVPMSGPENYTVTEQLEGYEFTCTYDGLDEKYAYPTNVYTGEEPDMSKKETNREPLPGDGDWYIQSDSLDKDYIKGTDIVFGAFDIGKATIQEYYADGQPVTVAEDRQFWKNTNGNYNDNGSTVMFYPERPLTEYAVGELITTDHYFTLTFPNAITYLDGETLDGRPCDAVVTFRNLNIVKARDIGAKGYRVAYPDTPSQLWVGAGSNAFAVGGAQMDITLTIPGADSASVLVAYTDIDIPTDEARGTPYSSRPEAVSLVSGFEPTVFTLGLTTDTPQSMQTRYTAFEQSDGVMRAYAYRTNETAGTFLSGFIAAATMGRDGITIRWTGSSGCATQMFQTIPPFRLKTTIDGKINPDESEGGTITDQSDWTARDYGEGKMITITPDQGYHIDSIKIDGNAIDLDTLAKGSTLTITNTGWTETNKGTENVFVYQRADGVVDVYLPKQYLVSGNSLNPTRTDHWVDASFAVNGYKYTVTNTQIKDIKVTKVWQDDDNKKGLRPNSVSIDLFADDEKVETAVITEEDQWSVTFPGLPMYKDGEKIDYTVTEQSVEGYAEPEIEGSAEDGFTITNRILYTITYKLNGGTYSGSPDDILEEYPGGTEISIHEAPVRAGYTFQYWESPECHPGDTYTVTEDHTFTAVWKKNESGGGPDKKPTPVIPVPVPRIIPNTYDQGLGRYLTGLLSAAVTAVLAAYALKKWR